MIPGATVNMNDRREVAKFMRFLRAMKEPGAQLFDVYARFYGEVVYEAPTELVQGAAKETK